MAAAADRLKRLTPGKDAPQEIEAAEKEVNRITRLEWLCEYYDKVARLTSKLAAWLLTPEARSVSIPPGFFACLPLHPAAAHSPSRQTPRILQRLETVRNKWHAIAVRMLSETDMQLLVPVTARSDTSLRSRLSVSSL